MRPRRARRFAAAFIGSWLTAAALTTVGVARADDNNPIDYAFSHETIICGHLASNPSINGLQNILDAIQSVGGFGAYDSGVIVATAVKDGCPLFWPILARYAAIYGGQPA